MTASLGGTLREHLLDLGRTLHEHTHALVTHDLHFIFAKAKLDETATLRRVLARLAGRRLARTNMRFLAECTTCTHSSALFLLSKTGGEKGDRTLDLRLMSPALYQLSYLALGVCKISYPALEVNG